MNATKIVVSMLFILFTIGCGKKDKNETEQLRTEINELKKSQARTDSTVSDTKRQTLESERARDEETFTFECSYWTTSPNVRQERYVNNRKNEVEAVEEIKRYTGEKHDIVCLKH